MRTALVLAALAAAAGCVPIGARPALDASSVPSADASSGSKPDAFVILPADGSQPAGLDAAAPLGVDAGMVTATPVESAAVLLNPGIGFADFAMGWGGPFPPESEYPKGKVAYLRWTWADLEPTEGAYAFAMIDQTIASAAVAGEHLAFRVMTSYANSTPQWLLDKGVASVATDDGRFPDYNDATFLEHHQKLVHALAQRYAGKPEIDHVDVGTVGCWGEWNTACCSASLATCQAYFPTEANQKAIIDLYVQEFVGTPLVMLVGGPLAYAVGKGTGWRGDCFGDYGMFGAGWNHMVDLYGPTAADPVTGVAWKTAPVQFEACGVMQDWFDKGFDIDLILAKGLEWHMSVFNGKSSAVPATWRPKVDEWLKKVGYRLVLRSLSHPAAVKVGGALALGSSWSNRGVAPVYHPWPMAWRLRAADGTAAAQAKGVADLRTWLPGDWDVADSLAVPGSLAPGTYAIDVAVLAEDGSEPFVGLAIEGRRDDGWYSISSVEVVP